MFLTPEAVAGIELMEVLVKCRASLCVYDVVFKWHTEHMNAHSFMGRDPLVKMLNERYNMIGKKPYEKEVTLPHCQATIKVVVHDAPSQFESILSEPEINDEDYLFTDDDPFAPPPKKSKYVGDINTGTVYYDTYQKWIAPNPIHANGRRKVLAPFLIYCDGCVTGQYDSLPLEAVKVCSGLHKASVRKEQFIWRNVGYVAHAVIAKIEGGGRIEGV